MNKIIMKKIKLLILIFLLSPLVGIQAQNPELGVEEFQVDGVKVLLKHSPKEVVNAKLFINGGTANYSKEQEGIENFAMNLAISGGTTSLNKNDFSSATDKIGTVLSASSDYDFSQFQLRCVKQYWNESWNLFADAIMNPAFSDNEFNILKEQLINNAKQASSDPDTQLRNLAMSNVFKGKNYEKIATGTETSLQKITLKDLKNHYDKVLGKKRLLLVVVGDIAKEDLLNKLKSSFGKLNEGSLPTVEEPTQITTPTNVIEDRDIATNYIRGYMTAPKMDSKEGVAMMIAMRVLRQRLFIEIRTKRGLSYAPSSFYSNGIVNSPYNAIYVTTTDPKQSMEVMVNEIDKLRNEGFTQKELLDIQQTFLTNHYMGLETMASQSSNLGLAELKGNWKMSEEFSNIVNDITLEDMNNAIKKYTDKISWSYLGKKDMVNEEDFVQPKPIKKEIPIKD